MEGAASKSCADMPKSLFPKEDDMKEGKANPVDPKHCFGLSFQAALIRALRIPGTAGVKVDIARKINGGDLDWALGAAVKHFIDTGMGGTALDGSSAQSSMMLAMVAFAGIGLVIAAMRFWSRRKNCPKNLQHMPIPMEVVTIGGKGAE
jgi:hypothetical protein